MDVQEATIENEQLEKAARNMEYFSMIDRCMAQLEAGEGQEHELIEENDEIVR